MELQELDPTALTKDIVGAATGALGKDVSTIEGFAQSQVAAIAHQASLVAKGIADGSIGQDLREYFLDNLKQMATSFANTLIGLVEVAIEKLINAIVGAIWDAIGKAAGIALPL